MNTNNKLRILPKKVTIPAVQAPEFMQNPGLHTVQTVAVP